MLSDAAKILESDPPNASLDHNVVSSEKKMESYFVVSILVPVPEMIHL